MNDAYIIKRNPDLIERKVIEDIKAEIRGLLDECYANTSQAKAQAIALMWCLQVIDKHIKQEEQS